MAACQARLNCSAARRGSYVSVATAHRRWYPCPCSTYDRERRSTCRSSSTSFSCTVNQPSALTSGIRTATGSLWTARVHTP